jgi:hypothetical protein
MPVVKFDISPPLRSMKSLPWKECTKSENEGEGPIPLGAVGPVARTPFSVGEADSFPYSDSRREGRKGGDRNRVS